MKRSARSEDLRTVVEPLLAWYDRAKRDLPWRRTSDPYAILVSEMMLQQTRVETALRYWPAFLAAFPTTAALAAAPIESVLARWAGLGYYRRARLLHRCATAIEREHGGRFPDDPAAIEALPGIGRYTAGAIASIAFGLPRPLVDGNVARVFCRLLRIAADSRDAPVAKRLWSAAEELVPPARPGEFNQALMELGATVCTPRQPRCGECPIAFACAAREAGEVASCPSPRKRREPVAVRLAAALIRRGSALAVVRRSAGTRMAGLFDLPAIEVDADADAAASLSRALPIHFGIDAAIGARVGCCSHAITHHRVRVEVFEADVTSHATSPIAASESLNPLRIGPRPEPGSLRFVPLDDLGALGLSAIATKALAKAGVLSAPLRASARRRSPQRSPSPRP